MDSKRIFLFAKASSIAFMYTTLYIIGRWTYDISERQFDMAEWTYMSMMFIFNINMDVIVITIIFFQWKTKWPAGIHWGDIGFLSIGTGGFLYNLWFMLMYYEYGSFISLSYIGVFLFVLGNIILIKWVFNPSRQKSKKQNTP